MREWDEVTDVHSGDGLPSEPTSARDRACLIVLTGVNVGETFRLTQSETVIGRGDGCTVQVLDDGASRRHALLRIVANEAFLEDLSSRNGTFINGRRVDRQRLHDGDKIQVGLTTILKFAFQDEVDETFQRRMFESALRDPLTRAFNKRYFMGRLESEFRFAKRHNAPLSLLLMDIDEFKKVNDGHGHLAGDTVLFGVARKIHEVIRHEDVFSRYGGEEFALLCRAIELDKAAAFAERLRRTVEALEHVIGSGAGLHVTVSIGVAGLPALEATEPLQLMAAADDALYAAKRAGRNRVCIAPPM